MAFHFYFQHYLSTLIPFIPHPIIHFSQTHFPTVLRVWTHLFHFLGAVLFFFACHIYDICHSTSQRFLFSLNSVNIHYLYHSFKHNVYKPSYMVVDVSWVTVLIFQDYIFPDDSYGFSFIYSQPHAFYRINK